MFRKAFSNANSSVFQVGGENIIMLIISILVAIVLKPLDPFLISPYLPPTISKEFFITGFYTLFVLLILYLLILLYHLVVERRKILDHKDIQQLGNYRTDGVAIRNDIGEAKNPDDLDILFVEFKTWDKNMLKALALISPGEASWLETLDRMPPASGNFINDNHRVYVAVMNEKLARLDMIIRKHLDLPQKDLDRGIR